MKAEKELLSAVRAGYSFFYTQTYEMDRSITIIKGAIESFKNSKKENPFQIKIWDFEKDQDPESVLRLLEESAVGTVVIAKNFNWFLKDDYNNINKNFVQFFQNRTSIYSSREYRKVLIIVSDTSFEVAIPDQLRKDFFSLEFNLPDEDEIKKTLDGILSAVKDDPKFVSPNKEEIKNVIDSSKGLTKRELQNAYAFSLIKDEGKLKSETVSEIQAREVQGTAGLKIGKYPNSNFSNLKGYEQIKEFVLGTITSPLAKGIMILGPPGTGKTEFCKCLGTTTGKKVIEMEMAELFGSLVGESEKLMKAAIQIITANSPCILFIDEIEKGLSGVGNSQTGDGGTTKRSMSQFLKFLSNRPDGVYVIATCNDISALPPEWVRAERWDCAPFFVDLPNREEQEAILLHYKKVYEVKGDPVSLKGWSGAEIKASCRIAKMLDKPLDKVEKFVIPVSKTMGEQIDQLRKWSENRCIPASTSINNGAKIKKRAIEI